MLKGEGVYTEVERRTLALSYLISNLFEAKSLDECLDVAIKGLSMLDFFQSQINLLEDGYFVVKRNHMDKKYQFLLEQIWGQKFLGHKIDARSPFISHLLDSKIVATIGLKDAVKVKLEDIIREYLPKEIGASKRLGMLTRVVSIIPKRIDLMILPLNYQGKVIGAVGISSTSLEREDVLFLRNLCELFAQAFEKVQTRDYLRESEEKFRNLAEQSPSMIFINKKGRVVYANKKCEEIIGYKREEFYSPDFDFFTLIAPESIDLVKIAFSKHMKGGEVAPYEYRLITKEGKKIETILATKLIRYEGETAILGIVTDITGRKEAEERVKRSEEKYRSIVELAPDGIAIMNMKGVVTSVNPAFLKLTGYSKDEIVGKHFTKLRTLRARDIPKYTKLLSSILRGKIPPLVEFVYVRKDGTQCFGEARLSLLEESGKKTGLQAILRDITKRKKVKEALKESEERLKQLIEYAPDAIYINDLKGNFIDGNKQAEKLTGYKRDELVGKSFLKVGLLPKRYVPKAMKALTRNVLGKKTGPDEFELTRKDGTRVPVEVSTFPVKRGGKVEVIGIARDITERKRIEEALGRSEEKYRNIVELAPDSIMTLDLKGVITSVNTASTRMSGYSQDEFVGKHFSKMGPIRARDIPKYLKMLPSTLRGKVPKPFEITYHRKNGTLGFGEVHMSLMKEGGKATGIQAIMRDITERKRMDDELKRYSEHLEELVEERTRELKESQERLIKSERLAAIGELATMVGHDLRNPLQSIENATYYLNNELPHLPSSTPISQKTIEMLQVINNSVNYADKIIRDLQDFSATKKPRLKKTNINTIVKETLSQVEAPENVELITKLSRLPEIKTDKNMIKRILLSVS